MKSFFRLLLFVSLIFIVGCTITKRRYTGGYYINWHNKAPDARIIAQRKATQIASNKIAHSSNSPEKTVIAPKAENPIIKKLVRAVTGMPQEKLLTNNFLSGLLPKSGSYTRITPPSDTILGHNQREINTSKKDVRFSWLFCLLGIIIGILAGGIVASVLIFNADAIAIGILLFLPLALIIFSLVHSYKAIKFGHKWGLLVIVFLDIRVYTE